MRRVTPYVAIILCGCSLDDTGTGTPNSATRPNELAYPTRTTYRLKGIQPDFWPSKDDIAGANAGGVVMDMVWAGWEPMPKSPPCDSAEQEYDGRCFRIDERTDAAIAEWTSKGLVVTAILYGVPGWARVDGCTMSSLDREMFCAPAAEHAKDFGRFAGMLAARYNLLRGHGRIADFVLHNEVNSSAWFNVGCGNGTPCPVEAWIDAYADIYDAAYDAVVAEQPRAKVLIPLDRHFGKELDRPDIADPVLSGMTFLTRFATRVGRREFRVAYHPYAKDPTTSTFSPQDYPHVTFGNLGVLAGWLRATFPDRPASWEIQVTEGGLNSASPSSPAEQEQALCAAFRNVLGTPGIESFIYHRMSDVSAETKDGAPVSLGLHDRAGTAKPAWTLWSSVNLNEATPPKLSCGFEVLPFVELVRYQNAASRLHWTSTRMPPAGYAREAAVGLWRDSQADTQIAYECDLGTHNRITTDPTCGGALLLGPVGYLATQQRLGTVPLYSCKTPEGDEFVSTHADCEGQMMVTALGYAIPLAN